MTTIDKANHSSKPEYRTNEGGGVYDTVSGVGGREWAVDKNYRQRANPVLIINTVLNVFRDMISIKPVDGLHHS